MIQNSRELLAAMERAVEALKIAIAQQEQSPAEPEKFVPGNFIIVHDKIRSPTGSDNFGWEVAYRIGGCPLGVFRALAFQAEMCRGMDEFLAQLNPRAWRDIPMGISHWFDTLHAGPDAWLKKQEAEK